MNRKQQKPRQERVESTMPKEQVQLLGSLGSGQRTITGVNTVLVSGPSVDFSTAVTHMALPTSALIDTTANIVDPAIQDVINAFSSAKGYTSSVTPSILRGHLEFIVEAIQALFVLKRSQDVKELTDSQGQSLAGAFTSVASGGRQYATATGGFDPTITPGGVPVTQLGAASISNTVWANTYLSELGKLVIPYKLFKLLESFYVGYYNNPKASLDAYFAFWPDNIVGLTGLTTPEVAFSNAIASIDSNLSSYPDLRTMIGLMGMDASPCLNYDWNRDVKGQTALVVDDPLIYTLINNEMLAFSAFDESDVAQYIQDSVELPFVQGSIAGFEDSYVISDDMLPYLGLFRTVGATGYPALLNSNFVRVSGSDQYVATIPQTAIQFNAAVTALSAIGEARVNTYTYNGNMSAKVLPTIESLYLYGDVINNDCDSIQLYADANYAFTGYNKMRLLEADHDLLNELFVTEMLFGTQWRDNLKQIANSVAANIRIG